MRSILHLLELGGSIMYVLAFIAWLALTMLLYRLWKTRAALVFPPDGGARWIQLAREGELKVLKESANVETSAGRIVRAAVNEILDHPGQWDDSSVKECIEDAGRRELAHLERYNGALSTIASIAPLLGLMGTVFGLILMFQGLTDGDGGMQRVSADNLADGIWKALLTTAAGLVVAVPSLLAFKLLSLRVQRHTEALEDFSGEFLRRITRSEKG